VNNIFSILGINNSRIQKQIIKEGISICGEWRYWYPNLIQQSPLINEFSEYCHLPIGKWKLRFGEGLGINETAFSPGPLERRPFPEDIAITLILR